MNDIWKKLCSLLFVTLLAATPAIANAEDSYSEAQELLFATQHLQNINDAATLYYDFTQSGIETTKIDDKVTIEITNVQKHGGKDVEIMFLSGEQEREYMGVKNFRSNPVIMFFLQWDVEKMGENSDVSQHYFRHVIRNAFVDKAQSKDVTLSYGEGNLSGKQIILEPFKMEQDTVKYQKLMSKRYEFTVSDLIPGGIYSIKTIIPGEDAQNQPKEYTQMLFAQVEPKSAVSN